MDEYTEVHDDVVSRVKTLMKTTFGDYFKNYYEGDPIEIPKANLPCMIIEKVTGNIDVDATGTDSFGTQLNIRLLLDKADDYGVSDDVDMTELKLRRLVEARHVTTGEFLPKTVLGVMRTNITMGSSVLSNQTDIGYDLQPRRGGVVTSEALVQIVTRERINVPNRT